MFTEFFLAVFNSQSPSLVADSVFCRRRQRSRHMPRRLPTLEISPPFARRISYETRLLLPGFRISGHGLTKFTVCQQLEREGQSSSRPLEPLRRRGFFRF